MYIEVLLISSNKNYNTLYIFLLILEMKMVVPIITKYTFKTHSPSLIDLVDIQYLPIFLFFLIKILLLIL